MKAHFICHKHGGVYVAWTEDDREVTLHDLLSFVPTTCDQRPKGGVECAYVLEFHP